MSYMMVNGYIIVKHHMSSLSSKARVSDRLGASWPRATDAQLRWAAASVQSRAHARRGGVPVPRGAGDDAKKP